MHDWLTIELALGTLLVTSYTCVGLLALWAATSPRHWFLRTAVVLGVLSPLLFVPAYEPFVAFVLASLVIVAGVQIARWWRRQRAENPQQSVLRTLRTARLPAVRFSLLTFLLAVVLVAIGAYVATRLPTLNEEAWGTVVLNGGLSGYAVLLGAWIFTSRRKLIAWPVAIVLCLVLSAVMAWRDWFFLSIVDWAGWPPEQAASTWWFNTGDPRPVAAWFAILPLVMVLVGAPALIGQRSLAASATDQEPERQPRRHVGRRIARGTFVSLVALMALLPAVVLWELLNPLPVPCVALPEPNGYDELVSAGKIAATTKFNGTLDINTATAQELRAEVGKCDPLYALVASALERPCQVPVDYSLSAGSLPMDNLANLRAIARALEGNARLAELEGRLDGAAEYHRQAIGLGYAVRCGGLVVDVLVGVGCSRTGMGPLYHARLQISPSELDRCLTYLVQMDAATESFDEVWSRERVWAQRTMGWHGHLQQWLSELTDHYLLVDPDMYPHTYSEYQAVARLLVCELAIAKYQMANGHWPDSLDELVPSCIGEVPADPCDAESGPLRYRRTDVGYILYSVGYDGDDDGGRSPSQDPESPWMSTRPQDNDLRLDDYFAPVEDPGATADGDAVDQSDASD